MLPTASDCTLLTIIKGTTEPYLFQRVNALTICTSLRPKAPMYTKSKLQEAVLHDSVQHRQNVSENAFFLRIKELFPDIKRSTTFKLWNKEISVLLTGP